MLFIFHHEQTQLQSLKETFAAKLPGEIEKIKKLRKFVDALA